MSESTTDPLAPLRRFVQSLTTLINSNPDEATLLANGGSDLQKLLETDAWLPEAHATPRSNRHVQHLLHCDPLERFSVVSFVWGPGQQTPIHNHTVWGLVGVLRGFEQSEAYELCDGIPIKTGSITEYSHGQVYAFSPAISDWHRVTNTSDQTSVSIHVYGGNIGVLPRKMFDEDQGLLTDFISKYDNTSMPNLWSNSLARDSQLL